jgi:CHAT domain-containing protein/tetratricopeptide (TPR) repeat protein
MIPPGAWRRLAITILICLAVTPVRPSYSSVQEVTLDSVQNRANAMLENGDFRGARPLFEQCFTELEATLGSGHPRTASAAIDYSVCLGNLGEYGRSEAMLRRCLEQSILVSGEHTGAAGRLMLALAEVLSMLGRHSEATTLYRQAALIVAEAYGPAHRYTAAALSGLAHTKRQMSDAPGAEALYRRSIEIVEQTLGPSHPDLIHYRARLGMCVFEVQNDPALGLRTIERAIALADSLYGSDSYQVALEQRHAGLLLVYLRRYDEADDVFSRSLATLERYFGPYHPYLSKCLKGLADVSSQRGDYEEAYGYISRAIALHEHGGGRDRFELVFLLGWKSTIELHREAWEDAVTTALRAVDIAHSELYQIYQVTSAREAVMYAYRPQSAMAQLVAAADALPVLPEQTCEQVFARVIDTHGQVLDRLAERQRYLDRTVEPERIERARREYEAATQRVVDLVIGASTNDTATREAELEGAHITQERAERELSATMELAQGGTSPRHQTPPATVEQIAETLDDDATLVHFILFPQWLRPDPSSRFWRRNHYGAFVLHKDPGGETALSFIDLGPASVIDSLIFAGRDAIEQVPPGRRPTAREEAEYRHVASRLHDIVWAPAVPAFEEGDHAAPRMVFVVPVSWLHLVDFNALLDPSGELVIERRKLHHLSSARDLLRVPREHPQGRGLLVVGNPLYEPKPRGDGTLTPGLCVDGDLVRAGLPGAEKEVRAIAQLFEATTDEPATLMVGAKATKSAVREQLGHARIAHFATHGFFCDEDERESIPYAHRLVDPLLQSGLVLSNQQGDGLLTAQELVCLDLRDLDWVVLSACGSGLGRLITGEGTFGLRRAFEIAGARTVVSTLWQVGDTRTTELMLDVYRRRLAGSSTIDAVRMAQLERLRDQRRRFNRIHPSLWGGIVAEGDWR